MLDNSKLWKFQLAINDSLNDILNLCDSQRMLEKHSWGMTSHAIGRLLQGARAWRMCCWLLAAKLCNPDAAGSYKQQLASDSDIGKTKMMSRLTKINKHSRWLNVSNDSHQLFPLKTFTKAEITTPKCRKSCWLAANNKPKGIFSFPVTLYSVASCLVDREQSAHGRRISTVRAQFKGNFFQKQAKETMVWWKIPLIYSSWDKSQNEQHRSKFAHCYSTEDCRKQPWNVIKKIKQTNKKSLRLKNQVQDGCLDLSVKWYWMNRCRAERLSVLLLFFLFPLEWLQGWLPAFSLDFLDLHSPIKALDLGLIVGLTSWRPELGRSDPERTGSGWNGSGWWVGGFYMLPHK